MRFIKYPKIPQFRDVVRDIQHNTWFQGVDDNEEPVYNKSLELPTLTVEMSEKIHGCLQKGTLLEVKDIGLVPIENITISMSVLGFNHESKKEAWTKVLNTINQDDENKNWYEIEIENGKTITLTGNHKIFIENKNKYICVSDLFNEIENENYTIISQF